MSEYSVVGKRMPRVDALDKVMGTALYSADVFLPQMLYGKVLRSSHPHAKICRLDVTKAQSLEGVGAIITAADVPGYQGESELFAPGLPHLAREKVVFEGQPVAAVAAINHYVAEEALGLVEVDYEELPPLFDVSENMKSDATLIYSNLFTQGPLGRDSVPSNVAWRVEFKRGDVETGFTEAHLILEDTFHTQMVHQGYIEPMAAVANVDISGKVTVWTQSQGIFQVRELLAKFLKLPLSRIRVIPVEVGGAFGGKTYQLLAPLCALLACKTRHPVKMEMTREEVLKASRPAPASLITVKMGVTNEGRLTAASIKMLFDEGAFPERPYSTNAALTALSLYNIPNFKIEAFDVLTNKVPSGSYRAPASPQAAFAVESQMDLIARALGMDPLQLRIKNAVVDGDLMTDGTTFPRIGFKETLERMVEHLEQRGKLEGENRGRGIACGYWRGGVSCTSAHVNINSDGSVNLIVGCVDLTGSRTSLAQIVAEEFGIPFKDIEVVTGDTETAPYADQSVGSRTAYNMGLAVHRACQDAKAQLIRQAALRLGVESTRLEFTQGCVRVSNEPEKSLTLDDLARYSTSMTGEGPIIGRGSVGLPPYNPMFAVHMADVEVDKETGKVKMLSYAAAQDVGLAINPMLVEGQIQGAVSQGIGWALMEDYIFDRGILQNTTLLDYRIPTATDLPFVQTLLVEVNSDTGPYGMRPVGEPPMIPTLATIANAIHDAVGVRLRKLPMSPEALFWSLQAQGGSR